MLKRRETQGMIMIKMLKSDEVDNFQDAGI